MGDDGVWAPLDMALATTLTDAELFGEANGERENEDGGGGDGEGCAPPVRAWGGASMDAGRASYHEDWDEDLDEDGQRAQDDDHARGSVATLAALPPTAPDAVDAIVHARDDAVLLHMVLHTELYKGNVRSHRRAWSAVARAFATATAGGGDLRGADVTRRLGALTLALYECPQRLPVALRALVLAFNERNYEAGYAARLGPAFLERLRANAPEASASSRPEAPAGASRRYQRKHSVADMQLCRLMLTHRPFEVGQHLQGAVWRELRDDFNAAHCDDRGPITSRPDALSRVQCATAALLSSEWTRLPLPLRSMLVELSLLEPSREATIGAAKTTTPAAITTTVERARRGTADERFMRVLLATPPFKALHGERPAAWGAVVDAYEAASGERIRNGAAASSRLMSIVRSVIKNPGSSTSSVGTMVREYYEQYCLVGAPRAVHHEILTKLLKNQAEAQNGIASGRLAAQATATLAEPNQSDASDLNSVETRLSCSPIDPSGTHVNVPTTHNTEGMDVDTVAFGETVGAPVRAGSEAVVDRPDPSDVTRELNDQGDRSLAKSCGVPVATLELMEQATFNPTTRDWTDHEATAAVHGETTQNAQVSPIVKPAAGSSQQAQGGKARGAPIDGRTDDTVAPNQAQEERDAVPDEASPAASGEHAINERLDLMLMSCVLAARPFKKDVLSRKNAWHSIAHAFVKASGGKGDVAVGNDVPRRLGVLTLMLYERPQRLSAALRAMVLEFNEENCKAGYASRLGVAFLEALRRSATLGTYTAAFPAATQMSKKLYPTSYAVADAHLCRLILTHRPFDMGNPTKTPVWNAIVDAFDTSSNIDKRGMLAHQRAACARVHRATTVLLRGPRCLLPRSLRTMLVELNLLHFQRHSKMRIPTFEPPATAMKKPRADVDTEKDELFMRVLLEKCPFSASRGHRSKAWDDVANAYVAAGGERIAGGTSAMNRLGMILKAVLTASSTSVVAKMVLRYYELYCQFGSPRHMHHQILDQLRRNALETERQEDEGGAVEEDTQATAPQADLSESVISGQCVSCLELSEPVAEMQVEPTIQSVYPRVIIHDKDMHGGTARIDTTGVLSDEATLNDLVVESVLDPSGLMSTQVAQEQLDARSGHNSDALQLSTTATATSTEVPRREGVACDEEAEVRVNVPKTSSRAQDACEAHYVVEDGEPDCVRNMGCPVAAQICADVQTFGDVGGMRSDARVAETDDAAGSSQVVEVAETPRVDDIECTMLNSSFVSKATRGTAAQIALEEFDTHRRYSTAASMKHNQGAVAITDEDFMRVVLDTRPYLLSEPPGVLWNAIINRLVQTRKTCLANGQAVCEISVRERVQWLTDVLSDVECADHARLTSMLKLMLTEYTEVCNAKLQRMLASLYELKPTIEPGKIKLARESLDGILLDEVLRVRFRAGESKSAWRRVARAVNVRVGAMVFLRGESCKRRTKALLSIYQDTTKTNSLSASERYRLEQLERIMKKDGRGEASDQILTQTHAGGVVNLEQGESMETGSLGRGVAAFDGEVFAANREIFTDQEPEAETADALDAAPHTTNAPAQVLEPAAKLAAGRELRQEIVAPVTEQHPPSVFPLLDDQFMQLVIDIRPSSYPPGERMSKWNRIAEMWIEQTGADCPLMFVSGSSAMKRVRYLLGVFRNPRHQDHGSLTPALRALIVKYKKSQGTYGTVRASLVEQYRSQSAKKKRKTPLPPSESATPDSVPGRDLESDSRSKRRRLIHEHSPDDAATDQPTSRDEIAFGVALRHHPIPADRVLGLAAWDKVTYELNSELRQWGYATFKNGSQVQAQIKCVFEQLETEPASVPVRVQELATRYADVQSSPSISSSRNRARSAASHTSASFVEPPVEPQLQQEPTIPGSCQHMNTGAREVALGETVSDVSENDPDGLQSPTGRPLHHRPRVPESSPEGSGGESVMEHSLVMQLLRHLERERRDHAAQLQALVALLRAEREVRREEAQATREAQHLEIQAENEAHRRQVRTVLDAIDRERQSRRDEVAALTNRTLKTRLRHE